MDKAANMKEQREIASQVMRICDRCPENGEFSDYQMNCLSIHAHRLAELIQAMAD